MPGDRRWALVVGASGYEFFNRLSYSASDATDFAQSLVEHLNFDRKQIVLLTDAEEGGPHYGPTRNFIFHYLGLLSNPDSDLYARREIDPIGEDDLFVFYFSGHGVRTNAGDQFLLSVDASDQNVADTAVSLEALVRGIEKLPCRHKILFIDACRADLEAAGAKSPSFAEGFGGLDVVDREGLATFYSCDPTQRSYEVEELQHGTFTYELLQAVTHEGVNTLAELDDYLRSRVPKLNVKHRKPPQKPFCVPNPTDMLALPLFRLVQARDVTDADQLIVMANELFDQGKIDWDWWDKLTGVWEEERAYNIALKSAILRRFHGGHMEFDEFQSRWLRSEKHIPSLRAVQPEVAIPVPNGARAGPPAAEGPDESDGEDE